MGSKGSIQGGGFDPSKRPIVATVQPVKKLPVIGRPDVSKESNKSTGN
jgi:hypothetical protein